ncbi:DNA-3-methyladenine glycosylase 2 family protein [Paenibacillus sp. CGMCC 1.16610]|uniref:DNA-3-methyladenine glycosylase II n=1 Tax=Paenibacillus anseongense TaxID=2682845 RepID=A0ABW9U2J3_9BACL|nr:MULTISPECIES: DNA-3-methyladenine glycosylase 2 family protein [Paenibacillus]MBA2941766.1 DNA-3-methyladenine glycosylase 2 family protein [Paenibacillus sp. CGMCC 1.16610]MVQ34284.1 DNA-3-methyladenine glycosylase 2 family protein [Paenibacillus anseongense]
MLDIDPSNSDSNSNEQKPTVSSRTTILLHQKHPAILALSEADHRLACLIRLVGELTLTPSASPFESLAMSIISQQLSTKAAGTIKARVKEIVPEFTPELVLAADENAIRQCGVSFPKIRYIRDLSMKVIAGDLRLDALHELDNEELLKQLTSVKGIGTWTAEMFMMFALCRQDIMSVGDAGLQRAARWLHQLEERKDGNYLGQIAPAWSPYRTFASLYLWRAVDMGFVDSGLSVEACLDSSVIVDET